MTTFDWTSLGYAAPAEAPRELMDNAAFKKSPFTGAIQKLNRTSFWAMTATWRLTAGERADVLSFLLKLQRGDDSVLMPYWGHAQRGAFGGSPVVNGAGQTGSTVAINGASSTITNWVRAGDWLTFGTTHQQAYMVTDDANSDGGGAVSVNIIPPLLQSPTSGEAVATAAEAGSLVSFKCTNVNQWNDQLVGANSLFTPITADFVQDVLQT